VYFGFSVGEVSCPTKYFEEASSISFWPSVRYGLGVLNTAWHYFQQKHRLASYRIFSPNGKHLLEDSASRTLAPDLSRIIEDPRPS